jgi:hypothetical protein
MLTSTSTHQFSDTMNNNPIYILHTNGKRRRFPTSLRVVWTKIGNGIEQAKRSMSAIILQNCENRPAKEISILAILREPA